MDFMTKQWFIGIIIVVILAIIVDGFRRMRKARQDSLQMSLKPNQKSASEPKNRYGSEFPNGGARPSTKSIDKDRIQQARSQYDFGRDMSDIIEEAKDKLREEQQDQWVDEDDGDAEYYARKWDDEYDEYDELDKDDAVIKDSQPEYAVEEQALNEDVQDGDAYEEASYQETSDQEIEEVDSLEKDDSFRASLNPSALKEEPSALKETPYAESQEPLEKPLDVKKPVFQVLEDEADLEADESELHSEPQPEPQSELQPEPQQTSLNLEETVPVLMETVDAEDEVAESEQHETQEDQKKTSQKSSSQKDTSQKSSESHEPIIPDLGDEDLSIRSVGKHIRRAVEPTIGSSADISSKEVSAEEASQQTLEPEMAENLETRSANKPKYQSKYFSSDVEQKATTSSITEVLVINVRATKNQQLQGSDLLEQVLENGLRYGAMNIFHYHEGEDGEGPVLFSMANMLKPGTFDLQSIDHFTTVGVTFFLTLPVVNDQHMAAYESMLATAKNVAAALNAELNDDQRSVMTSQTMEHYRERIRDFSRRQKLEKNK